MPAPASLLARAVPEPNTGCWLWTGYVNEAGYGRVRVDGVQRYAHRAVYELINGRVQPGLELDHRCRVRCCVNPAHLEPVSHAVNCRRGKVGWRSGARKRALSHCPRGHSYADAYTTKRGHRVCRTCAIERARARRSA